MPLDRCLSRGLMSFRCELISNRTANSVASSNDTKPIQTNNSVPTPQPMTAALIFRRQLVRHPFFNLQQGP
jgi:hypothetical protein